MDNTKVIFLDVDGVLNNVETDTKSPSGFMGLNGDLVLNLSKIIDATDAKIVLSSTWKVDWDSDPDQREEEGQYLVDVLETYGLGIADKTTDKIRNRGEGISNWLADHPEVKSWVAIDDDIFGDFEKYGIMPHLVKTTFAYGLTLDLADQAIEMLMKEGRS